VSVVHPTRPTTVLFDLFGTLLLVAPERLPTIEIDGGPRPSTYPRWGLHLESYVGTKTPAEVIAAFRKASEGAGDEADDSTIERPSRLRFRSLLRHLGCNEALLDEASVVLSRAHMAAIADATRVPTGHRVVLEAARRVGQVGIVTNFDDTAGAYAILARHDLLDRVDAVCVSEAVGRRKPHPLPVVAALRSLGAEPEDAVLIGDSATADVPAARRAGVRPVLIAPDGRPTGCDGDVVVVARLSDVPEALGWGRSV